MYYIYEKVGVPNKVKYAIFLAALASAWILVFVISFSA